MKSKVVFERDWEVFGSKLELCPSQHTLKTYQHHCHLFSRSDCENIWSEFEKAYVWRPACDVPEEAYDDFISAVNVEPLWNNVNITDTFSLL